MIKKLELKNFTVFKKASFTFGDKLNVIVGENGSGKTQLLKSLYAASVLFSALHKKHPRALPMRLAPEDVKLFLDIFKAGEVHDLINIEYEAKENLAMKNSRNKNPDMIIPRELPVYQGPKVYAQLTYIYNGEEHPYNLEFFNYTMRATNRLRPKDNFNPKAVPKALFVPAREVLSMYPHYQSLATEYDLPYDATFDHLIAKLGLPYKKKLSKDYQNIAAAIETAIDGKIFLRDEKFYYHPNFAPDGVNHDINMAAEGWRQLGIILQLLRNGSLQSGMVFLWDEPEANLNPQLICLAAQMILDICKSGIQVFIATQSLFLVNELEILIAQQKVKEGVRFFNLQKGKAPQQGDTYSALKNNLLLDEALRQSDRYMSEEV